MVKCQLCSKGELSGKKVPYTLYGIAVGTFPALVCAKCNEVFFDEKTDKKIEERVKKLGLWGLEQRTKPRKVGNSVGFTISERIRDFVGLGEKEVVIHPEGKKKLVIEVLG